MRRFQELRVVTVEDIGWLLDKAGASSTNQLL
jgi:hypothetical protein